MNKTLTMMTVLPFLFGFGNGGGGCGGCDGGCGRGSGANGWALHDGYDFEVVVDEPEDVAPPPARDAEPAPDAGCCVQFR
jgi:hypothetical protein